MCSSIVFVPNEICRAAAALLVFGSKHISAVLLFPSSILLRAITTGDVTQKHAVKTIHTTKLLLLHQMILSLFEMTDNFL